MKIGEFIKIEGAALMLIGFMVMIAVFIKSGFNNYVLLGLVIFSIGSLVNAYGKKQLPKN